ncbi:MAG: protein translocase subunit SecD [Acidobacteriia bacterium]|nr:protein translocase subunit SecD [Terriglobia bacterium]
MNRLVRQTLLILAIVLVCLYGIAGAPTSSTALRDNFRRNIRLGLDLRGGVSFILRVKVEDVPAAQRHEVVEQTRRVLERRINAFGLAETPVQSYGSRGNELLVQLPDVRDPARIRRVLESRTVLEWYAVQSGPYATAEEATAEHAGVLPLGTKLVPTAPAGTPDRGRVWYLLTGPPVIRGTDLRDARVASSDMSRPVTTFSLSQEAAARFERYTQANLGKRAAIVLDQQILSVPVIEDVIRDSGQIRGARSLEEAQDLALNLRSGALPAGVEVLQQQTVEPSLGADSIRHGMRAGAVGLAAVVVAMLAYYRWAGANATLALLLNGVLLLAALAWFGAVLTLPGIAGVILTIGMAVDSNVLIFERIREELRAGRTASAAIAAGFSRAFGTLVDTHVTTVVSCAFLFLFGTPAVKGFAITLVIGLVTNLFTSVFVSRVAFDWELGRRASPARLSI